MSEIKEIRGLEKFIKLNRETDFKVWHYKKIRI